MATRIVILENPRLRALVAPSVGGRIVSIVDKASGYEFLWRNPAVELARVAPGDAYDPNFFGGIDEVLPSDIPESVCGVAYPDHGELWTTELEDGMDGGSLILRGVLPLCGLAYERTMSLAPDRPELTMRYRLTNRSGVRRPFMWKFHAALNIGPGDLIECPAATARAGAPEWSRCGDAEFTWPHCGSLDASVVPPRDNTTEFLALSGLRDGRLGWVSPVRGLSFSYRFDTAVFPYAWLFASYGGFNGHYTLVLEPCTAGSLSVAGADEQGNCRALAPGESLETSVSIRAGATSDRSAAP